LTLPILYDGITSDAFARPSDPRRVNSGTVVVSVAPTQELLQKLLEVAVEGHIRLDGGFVELGGVNIDLDLESMWRERLPVITGLANIETRSEDQKKIGILHCEVSSAISDCALASAKKWVVCGDEVVSPGRGHGHAQPVKKFVEFNDRMGRADAGAGENHRALGIADALKNFATR
jgi:hypothetical protein